MGGGMLYATEMESGAANELQYPPNRELSCVLCYAPKNVSPNNGNGKVWTHWGSRTCNTDTNIQLYEGFMAVSHYTHNGGGANFVCMHPKPEWPSGYRNGSQQGNLLYGTEYENTGAVDLNHDRDAACSVCQHKMSPTIYIQWGRTSCSHNHTTEYSGVIMSSSYTQKKQEQ